MKKINLGIIGIGTHMKSHLSALVGNPYIKISAIVDPAIKKIDEIIDERYTGNNIQELLSSAELYENEYEIYDKVDAVFVGSPDKFHFESLKKAIDRGTHAMIEKPFITKENELEELSHYLKIAQEKKLILTTCHIRRFDPPFLWLKENLENYINEFGKVLEVNYDFSYPKIRQEGLHIGLLIDHFNHEIDLLNFLLGYDNFIATKFYDDESRYNVGGIRNDGVTFNFSGTRYLNKSEYPEFIQIRFERGNIKLYTKTGKIDIHNHDTNQETSLDVPAVNYIERIIGVNNNFIKSILNQETNYLKAKEIFVNNSSGTTLTHKGYYDSNEDENLEDIQKVAEGQFQNGKWELIKSNILPKKEKITGAFSVIFEGKKIFLTKNNDTKPDRGWDLPGGHIDKEDNLDIVKAGLRELDEEAGITEVEDYKMIGYIKISSPKPNPKKDGGHYPNPSYLVFYKGKNIGKIGNPSGEEIEKADIFDIKSALNTLSSDMDKAVLKYLIS